MIAEVQQVSILLPHEHPTTGQLSTGFSILLGGYMSHALKFTAIERKRNVKCLDINFQGGRMQFYFGQAECIKKPKSPKCFFAARCDTDV